MKRPWLILLLTVVLTGVGFTVHELTAQGGVRITFGTTSPEGRVRAAPSSMYLCNCSGGAKWYIKETGLGVDGWAEFSPGGDAGLAAGTLVLATTSACPAGTTEDTSYSNVSLLGTTIAAANVGTTGGANNITPAGTNSAPAFTGTPFADVPNHVHKMATGNGGTGNFAQVIGTVDPTSGGTGGVPTQTAVDTLTAVPENGVASVTPAGTVAAPSFTGTQFDNRSAFKRVVVCKVD